MERSEIRREVLKRRNELSDEFRRIAALKLADRLIGHQWFYRSDTILVFAGYGSEIDTTEIIEEAIRTGKKVYLPKVEGEQMDFYRIRSLDDLSPGFKGIPEPDSYVGSEYALERYEYVPEEMEHTLMIMPGVAFDPYRNRIGYGKGYYDRYLSDKEGLALRTIAVGFQCQAVETIPAKVHDVKPYQVILV